MSAVVATPELAPLFLVGTGRCGSSLLLQLLSYHPALAWMSHWTARMPGGSRWAALHRLHDLPGASGLLVDPRSRVIPQATESYRLIAQATDGLFVAPRELEASELTDRARQALHALVQTHQRASGRARFVFKYTGFPRVDYLRAAFPGARFVHVVRDGRAVASSLCKVDWWSGEGQWGWGPISDDDRELYASSGYHEIVLAGLYWRTLMERFDAVTARTPTTTLLTVRYADLTRDPSATIAQILAFAGLPADPTMARRVQATPVLPEDERWRRGLTEAEIALLLRALGPSLAAHGFLP